MEQRENKRRFQRIPLHLPVQYRIRGESAFHNVICDNIGVGGLGFVSPAFMPAEALVMLEINLLSRALKPIGKIAWTSIVPHSGKNYIGIQFIEMDPGEKDYLKEYMSMQTSN